MIPNDITSSEYATGNRYSSYVSSAACSNVNGGQQNSGQHGEVLLLDEILICLTQPSTLRHWEQCLTSLGTFERAIRPREANLQRSPLVELGTAPYIRC